jgi:hypothetical protein
MSIEKEKSPEMTTAQAMSQLGGIEQSANVMGANDYEPNAFRLIREKLEDGELSPAAAVNQAQGILDSKQDYH